MNALFESIANPEWVDADRLRLALLGVLAAAGLWFFRQAALGPLLASLVGAGVVIGLLHLGFHRLGVRRLGTLWPGVSRGFGTGLLLFCLLPPGLPLALVAGLAAGAVLLEGAIRQLGIPLAITGVLLAWVVAWMVFSHNLLTYLRPFDLRPLDEPIRLWTHYQVTVEPDRLYAGNVAGPLGATSAGLALVAVAILAYGRRASWQFLGAYFLPLAVYTMLARPGTGAFLLSGPAVVFAGIAAGDPRRLPRPVPWRVAAGLVAGAATALLYTRGLDAGAIGLGVVIGSGLLTLVQVFGLAGTPALVPEAGPGDAVGAGGSLPPATQLGALVLFLPAGLLLVGRDTVLSGAQKRYLVLVGVALYVLAATTALLWLWVLRLPA